MKKILITGENGYIGLMLKKYLFRYKDKYAVDTIDMKNSGWQNHDLSKYDVVFHAAAIVHKKEKPEMKEEYFRVNRDLTIDLAKKAKEASTSQFIFMSTMAVYGQTGEIDEEVIINKDTPPMPNTFYGKSKLEAEKGLEKLHDENYKIVVLRPPMVYGEGCPGNYYKLERFAQNFPIFPMIENRRSMIDVEKLCEEIKHHIDNASDGLYMPQDDEYINTSLLVKELAKKHGSKMHLSGFLGFIIKTIFKNIGIAKKVFGNLVYDKN